MTKREKILQLFAQKGGIIKLNEIINQGINKYHLMKLLENGEVEKLKHGFYKLSDYLLNDYLEITKYIPNGLICLFSAWNYHNLTTYIPHEYHVAIEKKSKIKLPDYPPIKLYFWDKSVFSVGKTSAQINDVFIDVYDLEKSVCDAVKFRNKIGKDLLNEVITEYLKRNDKSIDKLMKYAKLLRIERILKNYLDVLL